jgi:hypothetical protein
MLDKKMRPGYQGLSPEEGRLATLPGRITNIVDKSNFFKGLISLHFSVYLERNLPFEKRTVPQNVCSETDSPERLEDMRLNHRRRCRCRPGNGRRESGRHLTADANKNCHSVDCVRGDIWPRRRRESGIRATLSLRRGRSGTGQRQKCRRRSRDPR